MPKLKETQETSELTGQTMSHLTSCGKLIRVWFVPAGIRIKVDGSDEVLIVDTGDYMVNCGKSRPPVVPVAAVQLLNPDKSEVVTGWFYDV